MKRLTPNRITAMLTAAGVLLLLSALLLTVSRIVGPRLTDRANAERLETLTALLPEIHPGTPDDRIDREMPLLEVDGEDFAAILELPRSETRLPVGADWQPNRLSAHPRRYAGNLYDGSLVIGGSDLPGQFDFTRTISPGDPVFLTDMTGSRYSYRVEWAEISPDLPAGLPQAGEADLVLFARNSYSLDYTVIRCVLQAAGQP